MSYHKVLKSTNVTGATLAPYPAVIIPISQKLIKSSDFSKALPAGYGSKISKHLAGVAKARQFKAKPGQVLTTDVSDKQTIVVAVLPKSLTAFEILTFARKAAKEIFSQKPSKILVDLRSIDPGIDGLVADAFTATVGAKRYEHPTYGKKAEEEKPYSPKIELLPDANRADSIKREAHRAATEAESTNIVRWFAELPPNDLTCKSYVEKCKEQGKKHGLKVEVHTQAKLEKMGAGAFCAVAQGSGHTDAAIVALHYKPKSPSKHVTFVGKGIVYDTGGVNIKTGNYMYGMHGDMTGSAVALAMVILAAEQKWDEAVTAYLAIADNAVSNTAYRPNEVITSLSGKSIEIINTDAEGRMALADTLTLASREKTDLIMDFATLTGSAVRAIGTHFCTGYSNFDEYRERIIPAGRQSGERVWSFPLDDDLGECLESDFADTKQCKLSAGVDHIEAAFFLKQFVENNRPWVHIDLSASENDGGLAHVDTSTTGFGVRFASRYVSNLRSNL